MDLRLGLEGCRGGWGAAANQESGKSNSIGLTLKFLLEAEEPSPREG